MGKEVFLTVVLKKGGFKLPWSAAHFIEHLSYIGFSEEQKDKIVSFPATSFNKHMAREMILESSVIRYRKCGLQID